MGTIQNCNTPILLYFQLQVMKIRLMFNGCGYIKASQSVVNAEVGINCSK